MAILLKHTLPAVLLVAALAGSAVAQTNERAAAATAEAAGTAEVDAAPTRTPPRTGLPEGNGKWVPRVDSKTCPRGSVAYVDEMNGGVKCWVDTN
jgi:hypothetical protein